MLRSELFQNILTSLQVDNSSTACSIGLAILIKLLPVAAIQAYETLKQALPKLFSILGRVLCWKERHSTLHASGIKYRDLLDQADDKLIQELEGNDVKEEEDKGMESSHVQLQLRPDLSWNRLESSYEAVSTIPARKQFFQFLYFLFPVNTVFFLRKTSRYLEDSGLSSPWTVAWEDAMDDLQIRTTSTVSTLIDTAQVWQ